jgi:hypothetical protein
MAACHHAPPNGHPVPGGPGTSTTVEHVWEVESSGEVVSDTSITFTARAGRAVVLHHGPPDGAIFARLDFPADSTANGEITVRLQPVAGKYAFAITSSGKLPVGSTATFTYPFHFRIPAAAQSQYTNPGRFEQLVSAAALDADHKVLLLKSDRPATDMLRFPLIAPGSFALVVMR